MQGPEIEQILKASAARLGEAGVGADLRGFDSGVLGRPVIALSIAEGGSADSIGAAVGTLLQALPPGTMVAARIDAAHPAARQALEDRRFRLIECYLTFARPVDSGLAMPGGVRRAGEADIPALMALAGRSFAFSRWHSDPLIPKAAADDSRAQWVRNAVRGRAEAVYVVETADGIAGFVCVMRQRTGGREAGLLDLIAVAPQARQSGRGAMLVEAFLAHCSAAGLPEGRVGTQAHNIGSIRLYERMGFRLACAQYSYHCHVGL